MAKKIENIENGDVNMYLKDKNVNSMFLTCVDETELLKIVGNCAKKTHWIILILVWVLSRILYTVL